MVDLQAANDYISVFLAVAKSNRRSRNVKLVAKEAISYLDTRNRFWKQQIPHHIRERSTVVKKADSSKTGPPPTQAMYKFVIKEMIRINNSER